MKKIYTIVILTCCLFLCQTAVFAQAGILDSDFNSNGKRIDSFDANQYCSGWAVAITDNNKILVGGSGSVQGDEDFTLLRYNGDGSLDNTFAGNGKCTIDFGTLYADYAYNIALQNDGKAVMLGLTNKHSGGQEYVVLARVLDTGTPDPAFGTGGKVILDVSSATFQSPYALAIDKNTGRIGAVTRNGDNSVIYVLKSTGSLDSTFGTNGVASLIAPTGYTYDINSAAYQTDGKLIVSGRYYQNNTNNTSVFLARFNTDGILDNSFSFDGMVNTNYSGTSKDDSWGLLIQADQKIVVSATSSTGNLEEDFEIIRYNTDGTLDLSLNGTGKNIFHFGMYKSAEAIVQQADGKYLIGGTSSDTTSSNNYRYAIIRVNTDGSIDPTFGNNGLALVNFNLRYQTLLGMAVQHDGRIVVSGNVGPYSAIAHIGVARLLSGLNVGILEFSNAEVALLIYPNPINAVETLKYTLAKDETISIALYSIDGKLIKTLLNNAQRTAGEQVEQLEFPATLAGGNYLLKLSNGSGSTTLSLVK